MVVPHGSAGSAQEELAVVHGRKLVQAEETTKHDTNLQQGPEPGPGAGTAEAQPRALMMVPHVELLLHCPLPHLPDLAPHLRLCLVACDLLILLIIIIALPPILLDVLMDLRLVQHTGKPGPARVL